MQASNVQSLVRELLSFIWKPHKARLGKLKLVVVALQDTMRSGGAVLQQPSRVPTLLCGAGSSARIFVAPAVTRRSRGCCAEDVEEICLVFPAIYSLSLVEPCDVMSGLPTAIS